MGKDKTLLRDLLEYTEEELLEEFASGVFFNADHDGNVCQITKVSSIVISHIGDNVKQTCLSLLDLLALEKAFFEPK